MTLLDVSLVSIGEYRYNSPGINGSRNYIDGTLAIQVALSNDGQRK